MRSREKLRPTSTALLLAALSAATILAASGCAPQAAHAPTGPSPTAASSAPAPPLPTNEEALAIVEELVPKFLAAEAEVLTRQAAVETLAPLATEEHMSSISTSVDAMVAAGQTATGAAAATGLSVQSVVQVEGQIEIRAYGCYDVSGFSIVDASGLSVRAAGVPDRFPVVFEFVGSADGFRSNGSEPWSGANSC